jgi:hypothetical protein
MDEKTEDTASTGEDLTAASAVAEAPTTGTLPTDFESIEDEALQQMLDDLTADFDKQYGDGSRDIAALTALADDIDKVRAEQTGRATAAAEADAAAEALASRVRPAVEAAEEVEAHAEAAEAAPAEGEAAPVAEQAEPASTEVPAEPVVADVPVAGEPGGVDDAAPTPVVTAAARPEPAKVAARAPRPAPSRQPRTLVAGATAPEPSMTASLDFATAAHPEVKPGDKVTPVQLAASFHERAASMAPGKHKARIGRIEIPFAPEETLTADADHNREVLRASVEGKAKTAESLQAAGGWCAPSTHVFELLDMGPDVDNLFDVPTFGGDVRAGILFPSFFEDGDADEAFWAWSETADINAVGGVAFTGDVTTNVATLDFASDHGLEVGNSIRVTGATASGFTDGDYVVATVVDTDTVTVATADADDAAIAGTATPFKHSMRIPCPTWTEARMGADGLSVIHGNLSNEAWPELTADFLRVALASHRRYMSARRITRVVNDTASVSPTDPAADVVADLFQILELQAVDMRSQYQVGASRTVEVLIPEWLIPVMRANMAKRAGIADWQAVTDSQINGWLSARGIVPQYTPDWQRLYSGSAATDWPATVDIAMWFAGSYFSLNGGRIDLGVSRDPELTQYNDYTAAWFEEFWTISRRGPQGRSFTYTLTDKIDGGTGW